VIHTPTTGLVGSGYGMIFSMFMEYIHFLMPKGARLVLPLTLSSAIIYNSYQQWQMRNVDED
jgi:hypothetical protein